MKYLVKIYHRLVNDIKQTNVIALFLLWISNLIPNVFIFRLIKSFFLKLAGVNVSINSFYFRSPIKIDKPSYLEIGKNVFTNWNATFEGEGKILIGNNVQVGPNVVFATTNHALPSMEDICMDIEIKNNVWIGANVCITPGVILGPNVIVAAGAIVTKNFNNCSIGGVPAYIISDSS